MSELTLTLGSAPSMESENDTEAWVAARIPIQLISPKHNNRSASASGGSARGFISFSLID